LNIFIWINYLFYEMLIKISNEFRILYSTSIILISTYLVLIKLALSSLFQNKHHNAYLVWLLHYNCAFNNNLIQGVRSRIGKGTIWKGGKPKSSYLPWFCNTVVAYPVRTKLIIFRPLWKNNTNPFYGAKMRNINKLLRII